MGTPWCYTKILNFRRHFSGHLRLHSRVHFREHFRERVRGSNFAVRGLRAFLMDGLLGSSGGAVRAEVSGRGLDFLEVPWYGNFHTESFRSEVLRDLFRNPPKLLSSPFTSSSMQKLVV